MHSVARKNLSGTTVVAASTDPTREPQPQSRCCSGRGPTGATLDLAEGGTLAPNPDRSGVISKTMRAGVQASRR